MACVARKVPRYVLQTGDKECNVPSRWRTKPQTGCKCYDGRCFFCGASDYCVPAAHRIYPGELDGKYDWQNVLILCANCHRRVHAGKIKIDRRYLSSMVRWVLHYWFKEIEYWRETHPRDAGG